MDRLTAKQMAIGRKMLVDLTGFLLSLKRGKPRKAAGKLAMVTLGLMDVLDLSQPNFVEMLTEELDKMRGKSQG